MSNEDLSPTELVERFKQDWDSGGEPNLSNFLPLKTESSFLETLQRLIIIDLECRWKRPQSAGDGETLLHPAGVESYAERFPELNQELVLERLAKEEFIIRRRFGDKPSVSLMSQRFPSLADEFAKLDLEHPIGKTSAVVAHHDFPVVENFEIIRVLGEGGMGSVYLAEQAYPLRRSVALKVIRSGIGSKSVIARFEAERQALAMMDHPHIAKVLDGGLTQAGLPFFAMELVDGVPVNEYCDQHLLNVEDRLDLFVQTCKAVQHAHQKGILHRDLKPSNVLVAISDGEPCVKVIDFGLAKAFEEQTVLTDRTIDTQLGQIVGTPQYMSPEQSRSNPADIDTRTDVYSLGVMLYELLTGSPPLSRDQLKSIAFDEVMRAIREDDPVKPSSRVMRLPDASSTSIGGVAKSRLRSLLLGELDWIVMRCLEKDPERRYESPLAVANDLLRYRKNEPVDAGPPSAVYRFRKFARRYAGLLVTAAIVMAALSIGAVTTTVMGVRAISAERDANDNLIESERQRSLAEKSERKAIDLAQKGLRQAAALALRQAEASVANDDIDRGLAWYSHAMQNAPDSETAIKRVARQNLIAWSSQTARPQQTVEIHPAFSRQWLFTQVPVEAIGDRLLCRFPDIVLEQDDDDAMDLEDIPEDVIIYSVVRQNDFSEACPPMQPTGDYLNHWVDIQSERLVTLHYIEGPLPLDPKRASSAKTTRAQPSVFNPGTVGLQGEFIVQQWDLRTGQEAGPAIRWFGQVEYDHDPAFEKEHVELQLEQKILFCHDGDRNIARLWSLESGQLLGDPIPCRSADLSADGMHLATCSGAVARVYDIVDGSATVAREYEAENTLLAVSYSDSAKLPSRDALLALDSERQLNVWSIDDRNLTKTFDFAIKGFFASRYSCYIVSDDTRIVRWKLLSGRTTEMINEDRGSKILILDNEQFIVIASNDQVKVWNQSFLTSEPVHIERATRKADASGYGTMMHVDPSESMIQKDFSSGEQTFVVIDRSIKSMSRQVRTVKLETSQDGQYIRAAYDEARNSIARISGPNEISIFSDLTGESSIRISDFPHGNAAIPVAFSWDHQSLIAISISLENDAPVSLHRIALSTDQSHVQRRFDGDASVGFHPTLPVAIVGETLETATFVDNQIVGIDSLGTITIRDSESGKARRINRDIDFEIAESVTASQSDSVFVLLSRGPDFARAQRWDTASGTAVGPTCELGNAEPDRASSTIETIGSAQIASLDTSLMFSCESLKLANLVDGPIQQVPLDKPLSCHVAAFSRDASRLALSCSDNQIRIFDLSSMTEISTIDIGSPIIFISYFTNTDLVFCTAEERWSKIVDDTTLVEGGAIPGRLADAQLSRDGSLLATLSDPGVLQVWDCETGLKIGPRKTVPGKIISKRIDLDEKATEVVYATMGFTSDNQSVVVVTDTMISTYLYPSRPSQPDANLVQRVIHQTGLSIVDGQLSRKTNATTSLEPAHLIQTKFPDLWQLNDSRANLPWPSRYRAR